MSDIKAEVRGVFRRILKDIAIDLGDQFDQNFERQAFFSRAWERHRSPVRKGGHILVDSVGLRRSIMKRVTEDSITFVTTEPYAAIHNEGGEIVVTERMKRYFRARFYEAQGGFTRKEGKPARPLSDGGFYAWTSGMQLNEVAEFWRCMALMKVGRTIKIPRRQFLGNSPEVERMVTDIIERNLTEFINSIDFDIK